MVLYFTISNFLSIKEEQTLSFEAMNNNHLDDYFVVKEGKYRILKIATILGANASGKSNVLKAFQLFPRLIFSPCENKSDEIEYRKFALDSESKDSDSTMKIGFVCNERKYDYSIQFNNKYVSHEELRCTPFGEMKSHNVFERNTDKTTMVCSVSLGDKYKNTSSYIKEMNVNLLHNRTTFGAFQKSNVQIDWMKNIVDWIKEYFMPNISPRTNLDDFTTNSINNGKISKEQVADMLKKADVGVSNMVLKKKIEPLPADLVKMVLNSDKAPKELKDKIKEDPTNEITEVRLVHHGENGDVEFDFDDESLGTKRFYGLSGILLFLVNESHILCIDELESSMHPDLYKYFVVSYLQYAEKSQLVFTTHMREFLADKNLFRDDSIWVTEKSECGATELYSFADYGTDVIRKETNRFNAYKIGKLGGIPNLGDTTILKLEKQ